MSGDALQTGTALGPYAIQSPLGAWGMGEVYKARDTRLDRTVVTPHLNDALEAGGRPESSAGDDSAPILQHVGQRSFEGDLGRPSGPVRDSARVAHQERVVAGPRPGGILSDRDAG